MCAGGGRGGGGGGIKTNMYDIMSTTEACFNRALMLSTDCPVPNKPCDFCGRYAPCLLFLQTTLPLAGEPNKAAEPLSTAASLIQPAPLSTATHRKLSALTSQQTRNRGVLTTALRQKKKKKKKKNAFWRRRTTIKLTGRSISAKPTQSSPWTFSAGWGSDMGRRMNVRTTCVYRGSPSTENGERRSFSASSSVVVTGWTRWWPSSSFISVISDYWQADFPLCSGPWFSNRCWNSPLLTLKM